MSEKKSGKEEETRVACVAVLMASVVGARLASLMRGTVGPLTRWSLRPRRRTDQQVKRSPPDPIALADSNAAPLPFTGWPQAVCKGLTRCAFGFQDAGGSGQDEPLRNSIGEGASCDSSDAPKNKIGAAHCRLGRKVSVFPFVKRIIPRERPVSII